MQHSTLRFPPSAFDLAVSHAIQARQPLWLTLVARTVSVLATPEAHLVFGMIVACCLYWKGKRTLGLFIGLLILGNLLTPIVKYVVDRPRPTADLVHILSPESNASLPSGHTLAAALSMCALYTLTAAHHRVRAWQAGVILLFPLAVGWSRLYLGVHWVTDVFASYVIAALWILIVWIICNRRAARTPRGPEVPARGNAS